MPCSWECFLLGYTDVDYIHRSIKKGTPYPPLSVPKALKVRSLVKAGFDEAFTKFDVLLSPVAASPAFKLGERTNDTLAMYLTDLCTVSVNIAGLPGLSAPCGFSKGLPVGMQLIGRPFEEAGLLRAVHAFQQVTEYHMQRPVL
jgi:aspartyl-tRNA(Asn)/glutamyl-tRNA(Gln) amidotransferase subunit A